MQWECSNPCRAFSEQFLLPVCAGFAFVYMRDSRDAEDAIRGLDRLAAPPSSAYIMPHCCCRDAVFVMEGPQPNNPESRGSS